MLYRKYSTVQYSTWVLVWRGSTVQYSTVQYSTWVLVWRGILGVIEWAWQSGTHCRARGGCTQTPPCTHCTVQYREYSTVQYSTVHNKGGTALKPYPVINVLYFSVLLAPPLAQGQALGRRPNAGGASYLKPTLHILAQKFFGHF